ncbi:hypothetical protein DJ83_11150 [Halorubrum ezzemoulense]|uniref:Uncharacterized protein n=1 Tax=Halorubrum ezzemoulense TaxID=337243 RepID=A0A256IUQ4_HALEZ|nr:hypothetical protein [Halorubrum ezzemoulense]OYR59842.1 hypothetical protein DJ83_11150 [Halorubrum ezzemoulense]
MTADLPTAQHLPTPPFDDERIAELDERNPASLEHVGKTDWDRRRDMLESDDEDIPELLR